MTPEEILARLIVLRYEFETMRNFAVANKLPTAITMGLSWLEEDTDKVIADIRLLKMR
jgi:hypothetical protein